MNIRIKRVCLFCLTLLFISIAFPGAFPCATADMLSPESTPFPTALTVTSTAIVDGKLDDAYGKFGMQKKGGVPTLSPPLTLINTPEGTACYAIVMTDPDAHDWVHWLACNIVLPPDGQLIENASIDLADTMVQGKNSFGKPGYGGPTPPSGVHTYLITVYALDTPLDLKPNYSLKQFKKAVGNHVLTEATLQGTYASSK